MLPEQVISVYMDYESEPIWCLVSENGASYYANVDMGQYDFPPMLKHMLGCYRDLWESMHSSEFMELGELSEQLSKYPSDAKVLEDCLERLQIQCENMIEQWVKENNHEILLIRRR